MKIIENCSLQDKHTFHLPVKARYYVAYSSVTELCDFLASSPLVRDYPVYHIGGGSNLLFLGDYNGVILHSEISFIETVAESDTEVTLRVGAGVVWDDFVAYTTARGWWGIENLSLIPGEVGASAVQNIGAYGVEAKDVIVCVETIDRPTGEPRIFSNEECTYGYRESIFKTTLSGRYIVTAVVYRLQKVANPHLDYGNLREAVGDVAPLTSERVRRAVIAIREAKLPNPDLLGNAGSFFKNPVIPRAQYEALQQKYPDMPHYVVDSERVKLPAGWLIDRAGWKGRTHRGAGVYEKQSLVLVNHGTAAPQDIAELSGMICASVRDVYGVELCPEVNFIQS